MLLLQESMYIPRLDSYSSTVTYVICILYVYVYNTYIYQCV